MTHRLSTIIRISTISIGLVAFSWLFLISTSHAQLIGANDCKELNRVPRNGYAVFSQAYPQEVFEVAVQNHANYCCSVNATTSQDMLNYCEQNPRKEFAESPWLYDHLVDVAFRYLDGVEDLQYPNAPLDPQGKERVETIAAYGTNVDGAIPLAVWIEYNKSRGDKSFGIDIIQAQLETCEQSLPRFRNYDDHWSEVPLAQKYFISCEIASCIANDEKNKLIEQCQKTTKERIKNEDNFVQRIISEQGPASISQAFTKYALDYLTYNRMDAFVEEVVMMAKGLGFIDQKVPEITLMCSG